MPVLPVVTGEIVKYENSMGKSYLKTRVIEKTANETQLIEFD